MKEKRGIRWLHISDLHVGSPDSPWLDEVIKDELQESRNEIGIIDFIIISGDIIHQGNIVNNECCRKAKQLFDILKAISENIIICFGNHDYTRDNSRFNLLKDWQKLDIKDKMRQQEHYARKLRADFVDTVNFCKTELEVKKSPETNSYIYSNDNINIVALNTSVFSGQPALDKEGELIKKEGRVVVDDKSKLWISQDDMPSVNMINKTLPTIVIGHHPITMFEEYSRETLKTFFDNIKAKYYFCGHIHKNEETSYGNTIEQKAVSGLFSDNYNTPFFDVHAMDKSHNEQIRTQKYRFQDGRWNLFMEFDAQNMFIKEINEIPKVSDASERKELVSDNQDKNNYDEDKIVGKSVYNESGFVIDKSLISDGAIHLPYNRGAMNIYFSEATTSDVIFPHLHKELDEVTVVIEGGVYAIINNLASNILKNDAVLMPKNEFHSFIPISYPCKYITISTEQPNAKSERQWKDDIEILQAFEKSLEKSEQEDIIHIYKSVTSFLNSSILEVRWMAINIVKKILSTGNEDDVNQLKTMLQQVIYEKIDINDDTEKFIGINLASEFRCNMNTKKIYKIMTSETNYMLSWCCAYYLIKIRPKVNYDNLYDRILEEKRLEKGGGKRLICIYYQQAIIAILLLLIKRQIIPIKNLLAEESLFNQTVIPVEKILIHFVLWYTSFRFPYEEWSIEKIQREMPKFKEEQSNNMLRNLSNVKDPLERQKVLEHAQNEGNLLEVINAYFTGFVDKQFPTSDNISLNSIKRYLRIIVSENCNLKCIYCHREGRINDLIGDKVQSNQDFDLDALLIKAKECGFEKIKISGGEPLLYPDILRTCNKYQNAFNDIGFTTNGTRILDLKSEFEEIKGSKLSFNVTLNAYNEEKFNKITQSQGYYENVLAGIGYLIENGFKVKLNSVITSFNIDQIEFLLSYAIRKKIDIKFLDLFAVGDLSEEYGQVSIAEIKETIKGLYNLDESDFHHISDYLCVEVRGIKILIPERTYSKDCQYCPMFPCAEGLFGIRVYEDYSCAYCFRGEVSASNLENFSENIELIRAKLDMVKF